MEITATQFPLLNALLWQGRKDRDLTEQEALALYERNWNLVGIIATPTTFEKNYIRKIAMRNHSWLARQVA
ncbi:hypothetical protein [Thalassospira mesophila]|uniref:Uncharacterized protein n=1 Tax=Thalassospira mesophila TaxID=1293891 RepID=A0A1Y2L411_9PROT|nr:hypothetical protein [Thalassospira mesophila]OSQ40576.1 hypothetical protein TMES_02135 [Thalassospira mesophila]